MIKLIAKLFGKKAEEVVKAMKPVSMTSATYSGELMTIKYDNGKSKQYSGSCTVWHTYPMMQRCGTFKEGELCDIWKYIKTHGNPYPTAHLKKEQVEKNEKYGL